MMHPLRFATRSLFGAVAVCLLVSGITGCKGEERPKGTVSSIGSGSASVTGTGIGIEPGVVQPPPSGAIQLNVVVKEWSVLPQQNTVNAGQVYFLVDNQGPEDPHELVIVKSDLAPDKLPVKDGKVQEDKVQRVAEVEPFAPKSQASGVFTLQPGIYVLFCNIVEKQGSEIESHYEKGMRTNFTVR